MISLNTPPSRLFLLCKRVKGYPISLNRNSGSGYSCCLMILVVIALLVTTGETRAFAEPLAYIPNSDSNTVTVVNVSPNRVVTTIPLGNPIGSKRPMGVAITPEGGFVFITNFESSTVYVIDSVTLKVVHQIQTESPPYSVAITPDGEFAYIALESQKSLTGSVMVIDTVTYKQVAPLIPIPGFSISDNGQIAITPDGSQAWMQYTGGLNIIDTATKKCLFELAPCANFGSSVSSIAFGQEGSVAYISCYETLLAIPTANLPNGVAKQVSIPGGIVSIANNPDGKHIYLTNQHSSVNPGSVFILDPVTLHQDGKMVIGTDMTGLAFTRDGAWAWVLLGTENEVAVIETATRTLPDIIPVGSAPGAVGNFIGPDVTPVAFEDHIANVRESDLERGPARKLMSTLQQAQALLDQYAPRSHRHTLGCGRMNWYKRLLGFYVRRGVLPATVAEEWKTQADFLKERSHCAFSLTEN